MGAEILLQMFFKEAPTQIFDYLGSNKKSFIDEFVKPRSDRIKFNDDSDTDEDEVPTTENFMKHAASLIFLHVPEISYLLLKNYESKINTEEAARRTATMIKNRKTISVTEATAKALNREEVVNPKTMMGLIEEQTSVAITRMKKNEKSVKKKKKKKAKKLASQNEKGNDKASPTSSPNSIDPAFESDS